jgi:3-deoxy-D-manno-oct-2-ulosonic acid (Kdo) hydroxylase
MECRPALHFNANQFTSADLHERLEGGELVSFCPCPFALPEGKERAFLFEQRLHSSKKNISYDPETEEVTGFAYQSDAQEDRLVRIMQTFAGAAQDWLSGVLPRYARDWRVDRASYRPEEEATRKLRLTARNDLLHIDAFPTRPTQGYRLLRLYVNIHLTDPRVWVTSETFERLLAEYGGDIGLPNLFTEGWAWRFGQGLLSMFQAGSGQRTVYDRFLLRFHHFLKTNDHFQERAPKRFWTFPPGTAWLAFTDALSHADLRGRFALEQSFFVAPQSLALPERAPAALLERACGLPVLAKAA